MATATRSHVTVCYSLAAVLLVTFLHAPPGAAQPLPWQLCNDTAGNYTENSAYQANIRLLATTLAANASSSPAFFATGAAGAGPDAVYALALCRGDTTNASACASCVATAFQNAQQLCALRRGATMYDDPCILRYADWDFLGLTNGTDNRAKLVAWSFNNVSAPLAAAFDAASDRLVNATADYASTDTARRFATGEMPFDETYPKIYSLAQCAPVVAAAECRACLGDIIRRSTPVFFRGKHGGRVFGVRCTFRFETYPFFSGAPNVQLPGPPRPAPVPAPATNMTPPAAGHDWRTRARRISRIPYSTTPYDIQSLDSLVLDISTLRAATDNFSESNKLGEGGFGAVYKGVLSEGQEIAVKRLSLGSGQGIQELKTELVLVAKLQHKNLVKLIGVCLEEDEKLLVYEYMPNRSLDTILFDSQKSKELDWGTRLKIVNGVARGLQYLHEESQLKIVHRDLKPSNVLLDFDYNPKISDFGLAKLFDREQTLGVTSHIAGTYGYMAPEYAMHGQYSVKSDVFGLGVLILEIVTGRKNNSFASSEQSVDLLSLVWEHWTTGTIEEVLDPVLRGRAPQDQMMKLVKIGLLCVQDNPADRPMMPSVNVMLSSNTASLQAPSRPTFIQDMETELDVHSDAYAKASQSTSKSKETVSPNEASLTGLEPR
ncbi:hypothetical protein ACP70R_034675 [Stipagrostis hirtigluma subsp. patula]